MLDETNKKRHDDDVINNAIIESFCVHARNLFEFFLEEAPQYAQNYQPFYHISTSKHKRIRTKLNVQISHVKYQGRATNDADKIHEHDRAEMINILSDEIKEFKTHLKPQYSDIAVKIRNLPRVTISRVVTASSLPRATATTSGTIMASIVFRGPFPKP
jgi:hypothetical protein